MIYYWCGHHQQSIPDSQHRRYYGNGVHYILRKTVLFVVNYLNPDCLPSCTLILFEHCDMIVIFWFKNLVVAEFSFVAFAPQGPGCNLVSILILKVFQCAYYVLFTELLIRNMNLFCWLYSLDVINGLWVCLRFGFFWMRTDYHIPDLDIIIACGVLFLLLF